jgi:hypothetical protein
MNQLARTALEGFGFPITQRHPRKLYEILARLPINGVGALVPLFPTS